MNANLRCTRCERTYYSASPANAAENETCDDCGGTLEVVPVPTPPSERVPKLDGWRSRLVR